MKDKSLNHPILKAGKLIGQTINSLLFSRWENWLYKRNEIKKRTQEAIKDEVSKIPLEKLVSPKPNIAIPAIEQLNYCYDDIDLRNMYVKLLTSSMNSEKADKIHPAFIDIIRNLVPDEAKILNSLDYSNLYPIIDVEWIRIDPITKRKTKQMLIRRFSDISYGKCEKPAQVQTYLDNLQRLNLIEIVYDRSIAQTSIYDKLVNSEEVKQLIKSIPLDQIEYKKYLFTLTNLGLNFLLSCIKGGK